MSCTLKPFRDYDEHEVLNLFAFSGTIPVTKGHVVKIVDDGWHNDGDHWQMLGAPGGGLAPDNTVSQRYGVTSQVALANADAGENPVGILLYDVKEEDENGEKLIYNPRKAAEMEVALSGQAVPILTRGIVLYDGSVLGGQTVVPGAAVYSDADGELTNVAGSAQAVGIALGSADGDGNVLVKVLL